MKFLAISALLLPTALAILTSPPSGNGSPDPKEVYIKSISSAGTGCPSGTVSVNLSSDKETLTLAFDEYVAAIGPGVPITENRKNCHISLDLHYPRGFQFAVLTTDYRGFIKLDQDVTGVQKATYYFAGSNDQVTLQSTFTGPISEDYTIRDQTGISSASWSSCGSAEALNINSQIILDSSANPTGQGLFTTDSINEKVTLVLGIQWRDCE